jgi:hypothetical protein
MKNNLPKIDQIFLLIPYLVLLVTKEPFKNDDVQQNVFLENLGPLIVKSYLPLQFVKSS